MMNTARNGFLFTTSQWQELEHQVHIYKQMASGIPIPSDLLYTVFDSSVSPELLLHQPPHHIGWSCAQMGFGRKIDPEPGRCRRTDGKKWRCSKEAYLDSKYCERHMHRGKNRSRKPVEFGTTTPSSLTSSRNTSPSPSSTPTSQSSFSSHTQNHSLQHPYLHYSSYDQSPKTLFSSQDNSNTATNFMLESDPYSIPGGASMHNDTWQLAPLTMGSFGSNLKQSSYSDVRNGTPLHLMERGRDDESKKVMHHFFDQQKERKNFWHDNNDDNLSSNAAATSSNIQLSISIPTSSHDFFLTRRTNEK